MLGSDGKIHFSCNECGTKFVATTEQAGKSGKCKNCGSSISVPILEEFKDSKSIVKEPVSTNQTECPGCKKTVNKKNGFCPNCGNSLVSKSVQADGHSEKLCLECGNSLRTETRFCDNCGSSTQQKATPKSISLRDNTDKPLAAETQSVRPGKKKKTTTILICGVMILFFRIFFGVFVIQPIGAIPDGATIIYWRSGLNIPFIASADGLLDQSGTGVSLLGRGLMLAKLAEPLKSRELVRFSYSRTLYLWSTGGKEYKK